MKRVVFTSAPYGYGPTSKAICIAEELSGECEAIYVGMEPSVGLAKQSVFSEVIEISDRDCWNVESLRVLTSSDVLVSALEYRALPLAAARGIPSLFLDTLLWLRDQPPKHTELAHVYLAQQFFQPSHCLHNGLSKKLVEVGPILPKHLKRDCHFLKTEAPIILINFGGLQSPAMQSGADLDYIALIDSIVEIGIQNNCKVHFALPRYLQTESKLADKIRSRWEVHFCTQDEFHCLLKACSLLVTTPGLEIVYEAAAIDVPVVFLPPYNASQLLQNRTYKSLGIGLYHVELFDDEFGAFDASTLNVVTPAIQKKNANCARNLALVRRAGNSLAAYLEKHFKHAKDFLRITDRNRLLLQSFEIDGREAAANVVRNLGGLTLKK